MTEAAADTRADHLGMAAQIVAAYVSNNSVPVSELGSLLAGVHGAISGLATGGPAAPAETGVGKATAAQIRKSITHDGLVSFEDGKPYKTLRRHLATNGMTPGEYRERYGLKADYPMVAENYSESRRAMAKKIGLGRKPGQRPGGGVGPSFAHQRAHFQSTSTDRPRDLVSRLGVAEGEAVLPLGDGFHRAQQRYLGTQGSCMGPGQDLTRVTRQQVVDIPRAA